MAIHRLAVPALVLTLAACGNTGMLSAENEQLRAALEQEKNRISYFEQQAAIAAGCAWLVPVCPRSITATGQKAIAAGCAWLVPVCPRSITATGQKAIAAGCAWLVPVCPRSITATGQKAIAAGYGGGSSPVFWLIVLAKAVLLAAMAGGAIAGAAGVWHWLSIQRLRPEAAEVEAARALLAGLQKAKADLEADAIRLQHTKQQLTNAISEAREAHRDALDELDDTNGRLEAAKAAYGALNAFSAKPNKQQKRV